MCRSVVALALAACAGCYLGPRSSNSPLSSNEGVRVVLAGDECGHDGSFGNPVSRELTLALRIENTAGAPLELVPERMQLYDEHGAPLTTAHGERRVIRPGETVAAHLHFTLLNRRCRDSFVVALSPGMELAGKPIAVDDLRFTP